MSYLNRDHHLIQYFSMSFTRFIIPEGDPRTQIDTLTDQMRNAWDEAASRRIRFIEYKRALRRFHLRSVESDQVKALLSQV